MYGMKAYSLDLRRQIVKFMKRGGSIAEATRQYGVSRWTVGRYVEAEREGRLAPKPRGGSKKKFGDEALRGAVEAKPSATLKAHGKALGVSHVAIWRRLRQLKITLKKKLLTYRE